MSGDMLDDLINSTGPYEPEHSDLGASSMYRWLACAGSFGLSQKAPRRRASVYAATGTLAHQFIEEVVKETADPRAGMRLSDNLLGSTHQVETHAIRVDDDFIDGVNVMLDYVSQAARDYEFLVTEMKVYLDSYMPKPPPVRLFGRTDIAMFSLVRGVAEIVDYKNGSGILVSPVENVQLLYYAAGLLVYIREKVPTLKIKTLKLTVVQPHARSVEKVRSWDIDVLDLLMWVEDVLVPGVEECAKPDPPLHTGPWCRFCPAAVCCPELIKDANEMAKKDFKDHILPDTPEALSEALDTAMRAEAWINAIRAYATEQIKAGESVPHWLLEPTRPTRKWVDDSMVEDLLTDLRVNRGLSHRNELRSPAQIQKAVSTTIWNDLQPYVESTSSGVKLKRSNTPDAMEEFD